MTDFTSRAGRFVKQATGYRAFVPAPLPPDPAVAIDARLAALLSRADQSVGRLDGIIYALPDPDLFVAMYVRREAVLSSQIEGTQSSLDDVLTFELDPRGQELPLDVEEVVNYVRAMNYGLDRLATLPLSLRLIREIHGVLLRNVRGAEKQPGEFRTSQNWIGGGNVPLARAAFVPPPVAEMGPALDNFERFLHDDALPVLVQCALAHAQFETIHPFLDGNGRVGRLLIPFLLCQRGVLHRPLLYPSHYLKAHRAEYYDRLTAIRVAGDWEGWLRFFIQGVEVVAEEATVTARSIIGMREAHRRLIQDQGLGLHALRLLDALFRAPLVNVTWVKDRLGLSFVTASKLLARFEELGLMEEVTGNKRFRRFRYTPYLSLFEDVDSTVGDERPRPTTESALS